MLTVHHLSKSFDHQILFEKVTFNLNANECIGLVGPNGCGKTTLLRILAGEEHADSGHVYRAPNLRIGYLPQGLDLDLYASLGEIIGVAAGNIEALESELIATANALARCIADPILQTRYDDLLRRIQTAESGHTANILSSLGLDDVDPDMPACHLSGGQKTRLGLARVLFSEPQLLLLDEPTNHLDIAMLEWMEGWLKDCDCGVLIVSHDRTFLDHTITRVLEIDPASHTAREYTGNYSAYLEQRQVEIEKQWAQYNDQQSEIRRMQQDIARVKAQAAHTERQASSIRIGGSDMKMKSYKSYQQGLAKKVAKKAKSRERKLDRYLEADGRVEKPQRARHIKVAFNGLQHLSRKVLTLEELSIGYDPNSPLLQGLSMEVHSGQRIAVTGPNGGGKTTLLRTIAGQLVPLAGEVHLGANIQLGFMSQDQSNLDLDLSALDSIVHLFPNETQTRCFLANFLLTGDEPLKPIALLSHGQRARLALAVLVAEGCNCLLLDEPINHLDIPSRAQFEQALASFDGAVLAVVHDRYFIQRFAQQIWWVKAGCVNKEYIGGINL